MKGLIMPVQAVNVAKSLVKTKPQLDVAARVIGDTKNSKVLPKALDIDTVYIKGMEKGKVKPRLDSGGGCGASYTPACAPW